MLVDRGLIDTSDLQSALAEQTSSGAPLGRVLIDQGAIGEADLVAALASQLGIEFVDLDEVTVDPSAAALIPSSVARRHQAVPIGWDDGRLVVAMADPANVVAVDDIRALSGADLRTVVATREAIEDAIDRTHRLEYEVEDVIPMVNDPGEEDDLRALGELTEDAPIVKLANLLISQAVHDRASDIHIEPTESDICIRYRIDGVLHEMMRSPRRIQAGLTSRLKIMSELDIAERRLPQDGRMSIATGGKVVDLRVATLPTVNGEKIVMRILDRSTGLLTLDELGFVPQSLARYSESFRRPYGTILVTGPTGSGKSTTLYATLNVVNDESKNIVTVEDPVEYRLSGVNQVQVHARAGLSFSRALRSILRQDPDVILVGEIRDHETAMIAMEAALTGHLVFSSLHTNDACSTPTRLIEMGLEPYLISSALDCVVAQRLARRLCDRCAETYEPSPSELDGIGWEDDVPELRRPVGCGHCGRTGYYGRLAIHEVMPITEEVGGLIAERVPSEHLRKVAVAQGMLPLRQAGLYHARQGATSLEEVLRVVS